MLFVYFFLLVLPVLCNICAAFVSTPIKSPVSIQVVDQRKLSNTPAKSAVLQNLNSQSRSSTHQDELTGSSQATFLTSLEDYREYYGSREKWWGDFTAGETRNFYHSLLPSDLAKIPGFDKLSLEEKAKVASMSRHAARLYARERCTVPGRLLSRAIDGYRTFKHLGKWSPSGLSWDDLVAKYEAQIRHEAQILNLKLTPEEMNERICKKILQKSVATNARIDSATGQSSSKRGTSTKVLSLLRYL
mmetsp:Transcript_40027/g.70067  ORF Transcript_40027/g.70067 Transcript_40027/m.70067 type:complete len:246 (-) Transcript_40027:532-1269(-)